MEVTAESQKDDSVEMEALPVIHHGEMIKDRRSVFQGHIASIKYVKEVSVVLSQLKRDKLTSEATHFISAYRIESGPKDFDSGYEDGGEEHAGQRLLQQLTTLDVRNVVVVVTRWHGGVNLGSDRFRLVTQCARQVLEHHGYIN